VLWTPDMNDRLDSLLTQLRDQDLDRELSAVEYNVRQRIAHDRAARTGLAPTRMAAVGVALLLGTSVGGLTAASAIAAPKPSIFASADALAPSTLLEGRR
jgi:hypothetical protein